jgi:hypothetical protein
MNITKINKTYLAYLNIGRSTGAFPLFAFAVMDYKQTFDWADIPFTYDQLINRKIFTYDESDIDIFHISPRGIRQSDIIIINVNDIPVPNRENIRNLILEKISDVISISKTFKIAFYSCLTYEDRLAFFIYDLSNFNEEDQIKFIESIRNNVSDEFIVKNFNYNPDTKTIKFKEEEEPKEAVDVLDEDEDE